MHGKQSVSFWPFMWTGLCKHSWNSLIVGECYGQQDEMAILLSVYDSTGNKQIITSALFYWIYLLSTKDSCLDGSKIKLWMWSLKFMSIWKQALLKSMENLWNNKWTTTYDSIILRKKHHKTNIILQNCNLLKMTS